MKPINIAAALTVAVFLIFQAHAEDPAGYVEPGMIEIAVGDGTFSIHANDALLREILYTLAERAGFAVMAYPDISGYSVTVHLDDVSWQEGLAKLLHDWNYALAMNPYSGRPKQLILIAKEAGGGPAVATDLPLAQAYEADRREQEEEDMEPDPARAESSMEEAIRIANELVAAREDPIAATIAEVEEAADAAADARDDAQSAERYADALRKLSVYQDPRLTDVLIPAIASESGAVRSAALEIMLYNPVENDPSTIDSVRQIAASDPDPKARRNALEVYARYGHQEEVLSAVKALSRQDGPARDIAVREWIRIEQERAEAQLADEQVQNAAYP